MNGTAAGLMVCIMYFCTCIKIFNGVIFKKLQSIP